MKIIVTPEHVARGVRVKVLDCPLAIAINEQCPTHEARVYGRTLGITLTSLIDHRNVVRVPMPNKAVHFMVAFDTGRPLSRRYWWQWWRKEQYVFDIAIPELCATKAEKARSVGRGTEKSLAARDNPK